MHPFRWGNPSTWPWFIWVWLGLILLSYSQPARRWLAKRRANAWPVVSGHIESINVTQPKPKTFFGLTLSSNDSPVFQAAIAYSYRVDGNSYSGTKQREFAEEQEAWEYLRDLAGKTAEVHYNPSKPGTSYLSGASLQVLLQSRPPAPAGLSVDAARILPLWARPFLWFFAALSLVGLMLSLFAHIQALLGHPMPPLYWGLHVGIFVVWFPAVFVAQRRTGKRARKDFWKIVLQGAPAWMRYATFAFLYYAVGNFLLFMANAPTKGSDFNTPTSLRWFSGHWMAFYSAAFTILYAAANQSAGPRCANGHSYPSDEPYCPLCGQSATTPSR